MISHTHSMRWSSIVGILASAATPLIFAGHGVGQAGVSAIVGPSRGTVIAVGGGNRRDIFEKFIEAAGGPNAVIIIVPTAGMTPAGETPLTRDADGDSTEP